MEIQMNESPDDVEDTDNDVSDDEDAIGQPPCKKVSKQWKEKHLWLLEATFVHYHIYLI